MPMQVQPEQVVPTVDGGATLPKALRAGMVWVNTYRAVSFMMPFGGMKQSGPGHESGMESIKEFLETKSVWINTSDAPAANPFTLR